MFDWRRAMLGAARVLRAAAAKLAMSAGRLVRRSQEAKRRHGLAELLLSVSPGSSSTPSHTNPVEASRSPQPSSGLRRGCGTHLAQLELYSFMAPRGSFAGCGRHPLQEGLCAVSPGAPTQVSSVRVRRGMRPLPATSIFAHGSRLCRRGPHPHRPAAEGDGFRAARARR